MAYVAVHARSHTQAFEQVALGVANVISRIPLWDLMSRASRVHNGVFDFDGTLTPGSQWRVMGTLLPEDLRHADMESSRWYHSHIHGQGVNGVTLENPDWWINHLETGNQLAVEGAWVAATVGMFTKAGITHTQIEEAVRTLSPRQGVAQLMSLMRHKAVVSFGIEQFIQAWLRHIDLTVPVAASRLIFDKEGRVVNLHINIVGAGSKEFAAARFRQLTETTEDGLIVVGDSVVDVHMMSADSFNVLIVPPSELDRKMKDFRDNNLGAMWDRITMILADDSFEPLVTLLQEARQTS